MKCVKQFLLFVCLLVCSLSLLHLVRLEWMLCRNMVPGIEMRRSVNKWIWYFLQTVPKIYLHAAITWQLWNETIMKFCLMFETTRIHQGDWILWLYVSELEVISTFGLILHGTNAENVEQTNSVEYWTLKNKNPRFAVAYQIQAVTLRKILWFFFSISESASTVTHSFSFMGNDFS